MIKDRLPNTISKDYSRPIKNFDNSDFSIKPLKDMRIIDVYEGLDDECEFEKSMFNFGDDENLPPSDRAVDRRCKNH